MIFDSVGNYQQYLTEEILDEQVLHKVRMLFSSDYMIQDKLDNALAPGNTQLVFVNDLNDYSKQIQGKSQD